MFKNYFKIAIRNLLKNKVFSLINIVGLTIGISVCMLIFLFVQNELSYDKHWKNADRIVRINWEETTNGVTDFYGISSFITGPSLKENFPEIEAATRMLPYDAEKVTIAYEDKLFNENKQFYVDTNFMDVFNFELLYGDPATCLREPDAVVISDAMSKRFFGTSDPIGKILKYPGMLRKVTGVLKNNSFKAHFTPNALLKIDYNDAGIIESNSNFLWLQTHTYVKFKNAISLDNFDAKLKNWSAKILTPALKKENINYSIALKSEFVSDLHFDKEHQDGLYDKTDKTHIYIFSCIAIFLLAIACFNYTNLSTARSSKRAKEVGMRKVVGATRKQLVVQFLGETFIISVIAFFLAFILLILLVPAFNKLTQKDIEFVSVFQQSTFWLVSLSTIIFISLFGGGYSALYLSGFQPIRVLKGTTVSLKNGRSKFNLREVLVIAQFSISVIVIIMTLVVFKQLKFMKNKDLGFNKEQVLVLTLPDMDSINVYRLNTFKNDLLRNHRVKRFSTTNQIIGTSGNIIFKIKSDGGKDQASININSGDQDYLDLLDIKLVKGRNFSTDFATDKNNFILNEAAVKFLQLKDPLKTELSINEPGYGKVIGVIKDYNYKSPHSKIDPLVLVLNDIINPVGSLALIKLSPDDIKTSVDLISYSWKKYFPANPISYYFLDDEFNTQYIREDTMLALFTCFAILTVFISCLGLFGLASFVAEKRNKEIGIRKVSGASVANIVHLISKDFLMLVVLALIVGFPVAYYLSFSWLKNFAFKTEINYLIFISSGVMVILVAFASIGTLAFKAAISNPIKSLRTE